MIIAPRTPPTAEAASTIIKAAGATLAEGADSIKVAELIPFAAGKVSSSTPSRVKESLLKPAMSK
jgi:hypothetical protein